MSLLTRKRIILAKIESVYGSDPTPTGTNAMLIKNLSVTPLETQLVSRDVQRSYLGNSQSLLADKACKADFEVEIVGSGTVGLAPAYDPLLRACAMAKTLNTLSVTIAVATGVAVVHKAAHGYAVGDKVTIAGCTDTALNGAQTITVVGDSDHFSYATLASDDAVADGTPVINSGYTYAPVSSSFESVALFFNNDGIQHKILGAMGTVEFGWNVKQIPTMKFSFTGLYSAPTDTAAPSADYSGFMIPQVVNTSFTPTFSLLSYSAAMESVSMQLANDVQHIVLVGSDTVKIIDRKPAGTVVFEAPTIAAKDFFSAAVNQTPGALVLGHGSVSGYKVKLTCPNILLGNVNYQDSNGVQMLTAPFTVNPTSGNDDFALLVA